MTPLSPHPGGTAGYPCNLPVGTSPAAPSPQPGLLPLSGGALFVRSSATAITNQLRNAARLRSAAKQPQGAAVANADNPSAKPALYPTEAAA